LHNTPNVNFLLKPLIFEIFDLMLSDWVSFLAYPNLFGIKGFVVVVVFVARLAICVPTRTVPSMVKIKTISMK
jgi:hypothetical protein